MQAIQEEQAVELDLQQRAEWLGRKEVLVMGLLRGIVLESLLFWPAE